MSTSGQEIASLSVFDVPWVQMHSMVCKKSGPTLIAPSAITLYSNNLASLLHLSILTLKIVVKL